MTPLDLGLETVSMGLEYVSAHKTGQKWKIGSPKGWISGRVSVQLEKLINLAFDLRGVRLGFVSLIETLPS